MPQPTRSGAIVPPAIRTLASVDAPPAALSGEPCDRLAHLLGLVRSLLATATDASKSALRQGEAARLAAQVTKQARHILDLWAAELAYSEQGDGSSWAAVTLLEQSDALAAVEAAVGALGALPAPAVVFTRSSGIRPLAPARRAGGAR